MSSFPLSSFSPLLSGPSPLRLSCLSSRPLLASPAISCSQPRPSNRQESTLPPVSSLAFQDQLPKLPVPSLKVSFTLILYLCTQITTFNRTPYQSCSARSGQWQARNNLRRQCAVSATSPKREERDTPCRLFLRLEQLSMTTGWPIGGLRLPTLATETPSSCGAVQASSGPTRSLQTSNSK